MRRPFALALALAAFATFAGAALAADNSVSKQPNLFLLKSRGQTLAELRAKTGTHCEIAALHPSGQAEYNEATGAVRVNEGAILKLISGTNSIAVTAEELEGRPEAATIPAKPRTGRPQAEPKVYQLKSHGQVLAEIQPLAPAWMAVSNYEMRVGGGRTIWRANENNKSATARLLFQTIQPVVLTAEEIELNQEVNVDPKGTRQPSR